MLFEALLWKISYSAQKNTHNGVWIFAKFQAQTAKFTKTESLLQGFSCEFNKTFQNVSKEHV